MKRCILLVAFGLLLAGCGETVAPPSVLTHSSMPPTYTTESPATPIPLKPTQAPTDTPTPQALSVKQKIANAIQADGEAVTFCFIISDKLPAIDVIGQTVKITVDASQYPVSFDNDRAKECIFYLEKDAWTSNASLTQVTVHVQILLQDQYGKQFVGDLAWAILKKDTERQFVWENLDYNSAWAVYDSTYLLPS